MKPEMPEKFLNNDGTLNTDSLLKSYQELEKKMGTMISVPSDDSDIDIREKLWRAIGVPENADAYPDNPMFSNIPEIKKKFREIGLTSKQVESVYNMAVEYMKPTIEDIMTSHHESKCMNELRQFFGTDEQMVAMLSQINDFAEKNLPPEAFGALASSADGIKAIYSMMQSKEPKINTTGTTGDTLSESDLRQMMKDPKYWRDNDQEFVRKIESGFKKLYK